MKRYCISLALIALLAVSSITAAFGHGLGTDKSLPVTISNKQVSVEASLSPTFIHQLPGSSPTFIVRALDDSTVNATIPGIDFRVVVELRNETLLDQRFKTSDGVIVAKLVPDVDVDGWEINGGTPPDQVEISQTNPITLRSRILSVGGLYHIAVTIESSSVGLAVDMDRTFDLYVSIGRSYEYDFENGPMVVKTYYDEVRNFTYTNNTISFETPFTWEEEYVAQISVLHMEVQFPKTIEELQVNSYKGTINGKELEAHAVVIDDYTSEEHRIVHFVVSNAMLKRFAKDNDESNVAVFTLKPSEKPKFPLDIMSLPSEKFLFQLAWGPDIIETGIPTTFVMNVQDPITGELVRGVTFDFLLMQDGREIHRNLMSSEFGTLSYDYTFVSPGTYTLSANNINRQGESASIDLVVLQGTTQPVQEPQQPSGCLIATAAFGSELTPQVVYLRSFRENYIMTSTAGSAFMNSFNSIYYSFSPKVADYERENPWLQSTVKVVLYPLFGILMVTERVFSTTGGEAGVMLAGATASGMIGAVYLAPVGYLVSTRVKSRLLVIVVGTAAAVMAISAVMLPTLLPISTLAFVIAAAGSSAILAAKIVRISIRKIVRR